MDNMMEEKNGAKLLGRHIVADPKICHGQPTFRSTRIFVEDVLDTVDSIDTIITKPRDLQDIVDIEAAFSLYSDTVLWAIRELRLRYLLAVPILYAWARVTRILGRWSVTA